MPDLSVAYKLHLECGRLINLYDWLQAFIAIVDPEEGDKYMEAKGKPKIKESLQYPFPKLRIIFNYKFNKFNSISNSFTI